MLRDLHHIPLADLKLSKLNVRRHGPKDIDSLAASVAALGLIQPLLVRENGDGYEIVAGQRRYLAMKKLNAEGAPATDTLPCVVMDTTDDAATVEASLAENVERLPMDEMDQFEAFTVLKKKGLDEADIAAHFAISVQVVKRRLAIANLHHDIRRLYRAGDIDAKTLHLLTLATRERQKAWLTLHRDPEQTSPPPWQLKAWLLGGAEISCQAALFDEALYQGDIAADLFGDDRYFTDPDEFWCLQNAAIAEERDRLTAAGWAEVHVIAPDQRFQAWDYDKVAKAKAGAVYIDVEPDGHVTVHKGLAPRITARRVTMPSSGQLDGDGTSPAERPELSGPLANYGDLARHSAVRLALADTPKLALRLMLAHVIGGGRWWRMEAEPQRPATTMIGASMGELLSQAGFTDRQKETATLAAGTQLIDTLGSTLKVDIGRHWHPDDTFFTLVKDREVVAAMLSEVIGATAANSYLTETVTKKKVVIRKALAGEGRAKVEAWLPRYMSFPQQGYTKRPMRPAQRAQA